MEVWKIFGAPWCKTCQSVLEVVRRVSSDLPVEVEYIDVNQGKGRLEGWRYHVMSLPTLVIVEDDVPVCSTMGTAIVDRARERREELGYGPE